MVGLMKKVNNLYDKMCSYENLKEIYRTVKCMCKYYIRYMDDLIIIDSNKDRLVNILESIKLELIKYKLKINPKSRIYSLNHEFNFLYKNNLDKFYWSLASYNGLFLGCNIDKYKYFVII